MVRPLADQPRAPRRGSTCTIEVVIVRPERRQLAVCVTRAAETARRWELPWDRFAATESLESAAHRVVRAHTSVDATWMEQVGAYADANGNRRHGTVSVAFVAIVPQSASPRTTPEIVWSPVTDVPSLTSRQRTILDDGVRAIRDRMDRAPVAFHLLPEEFTLSELQQAYELLLGRRLHKASFRRALQAAYLVEPIDEWRSEGRGRPAQLFRYAPRRRRATRRSVRFDLLR